MKLDVYMPAEHTNSVRKIPGFRIELGLALTSRKPNGESIIEIKDQAVAAYWNKLKKIPEKLGTTQKINFYIDNTLKMNEICLSYKGIWADAEITGDDTVISLCEEFMTEIDQAEEEENK